MSIPQHHMSTVLREDYTTVSVVFTGSERLLTYKVHESQVPLLKVGSRVVVPGKTKDDGTTSQSIATVREVHEKPELDLTLPVQYAWVIQVLDTSLWEMLMAQDKEMDTKLLEVQRRAVRRQAVQELLADLPEAERDQLLLELKGTSAKIVDVEAKKVS